MPSKQADRRKLAKLRAEFEAAPWAIDVRALGSLHAAFEAGDLDAIGAALSTGNAPEASTKIINGIAVIPVTGVLRDEVDMMVRWGMASSYQLIERDFNQAMDNTQVKGVLFYFDSPGGSAIGCKRVADTVFDSRGVKPVRAYVQGICGSAAFYIASACDRIEATADSLVGSVGTIMPHQECSGALKEFGIGATVFTNADSPKKGHGNVYEPLSDEARKTLQDFVNSYGSAFIADVARYRGIDTEGVIANYGQGDAMRADKAVKVGVVDAVVDGYDESLESMTRTVGGQPTNQASLSTGVAGVTTRSTVMNERIKAQLFALGLIDSISASDAECKAAVTAWCRSRGDETPSDETQILAALQSQTKVEASKPAAVEANSGVDTSDRSTKPAVVDEQAEARLENLSASAALFNAAVGYDAVTAEMVLEAAKGKQTVQAATKAWGETLANNEAPIGANRVRVTEGADRYATDIVDALVYRASDKGDTPLSDSASQLLDQPLWAVAHKCLEMSGQKVSLYGSREQIAEAAMQMGNSHHRQTFFSANEDRRYIQASSTPVARPGDFPNILSALSNKYLDTIQLDDDYSYPLISALLPGGLNDFKPGLMINKGIVEEMDEVQDAEAFKELGLSEEVLSYIFMRRFGNKWGWTPVMIANDDMNAFAEGMLGLEEAWQVTQNRLCLDRLTANETLLDGSALFANRTDTGTAANNNDKTSGAAPSDAEWGAMETLYADIGGINTGRRVRGSLNVALVPTGSVAQEARRTFLPLNSMGLEGKVANTTSNVGLYRGEVTVIPESELRANSTTKWYGLRNPTRLNTATIVRAYFNGYGTAGRRERWYDPETKTTYVSLEGRIATATKNWRYAVRNAGA
jgi:signal peptide peptidase SppA